MVGDADPVLCHQVRQAGLVTHPPAPVNEPNLTYAPGSPERAELELELLYREPMKGIVGMDLRTVGLLRALRVRGVAREVALLKA